MDTIKVRQQVMAKMSASRCVANTFKHEGVKGFYKGMSSPMLAAGTLNSIFFGVYGNVTRMTSRQDGKQPSYSTIFWAGCAGGVAQLVVATPVDLVKIKMQTQTGTAAHAWGSAKAAVKPHYYKGPWSCFYDIYKQFGIKGCYKGLLSMAVRDVPSFGMYMIIYEAFIRNIAGKEENASPMALIFCGGMAGSLSWLTIVPLDVIKTRLQADDADKPKYKGMWDCVKKSYKAEGLSVFTRGTLMVTLRALPTNGAIFLGYVTSLQFLRSYSNGQAQSAA